jgi:quercetin dioxygenase-like cupin family protein
MILHHHKDLDAPSPYRLRVLIGSEVTEVQAPATFLAPTNTVHAMRNIGTEPVVMCIAYPSVNVGTYFVDDVGLPAAERAR